MINAFISMFKVIFQLLKYPLYVALVFFAVFFFSICVNIVIQLAKGKRFKKGSRKIVKKKSFFRRIFVDVPHQFVIDMIDRDPDFFPYQGCIIFEGRQGQGKTIGMVEFAMRMQQEYPLAKCISNLGYVYEDKSLKHWRQLTNYKNGIYGVIVIMDETQNWFSSRDSQNFPPEMLSVHKIERIEELFLELLRIFICSLRLFVPKQRKCDVARRCLGA